MATRRKTPRNGEKAAAAKLAATQRQYKEALEQQAATAEILKIISRSPGDAQPVFDAIVRHACRLCESEYANVFRYDGERLHLAASIGGSTRTLRALRKSFPAPPNPSRVVGRVIQTGRAMHVEDTQADPEYDKAFARALERRRILGVPLGRGKKIFGAITVGWAAPGPILRRHENLLKTFAAQAVIAIENARLFNETREALERQTATADILRVISGSPTDIQPVLRAVAERAAQICEASNVHIRLVDGDLMPVVLHMGTIPMPEQAKAQRISRASVAGITILEKRTIHIEDVLDPKVRKQYPDSTFLHQPGEFRSLVIVPMVREGTAIGTITVRRTEARPFSDQHVKLLQTFADQAVIAIENVRLFNETKESLERQTATAEILKVISSSPTNTQPVFDAIVQSGARLFEPCSAVIVMREGDLLQLKASAGAFLSLSNRPAVRAAYPLKFDPDQNLSSRAIAGRRVIEIEDMQGPNFSEVSSRIAREAGFRSVVLMPLVRDGEGIGTLSLTHPEPGYRLNEKQLALLQTFADQAVIAIENVRLFNETKEALEQQTASSEVLGVISSSPTDLKPVFDAILASATRLCDAHLAFLNLYDGESYRTVAQRGASPEFLKWVAERGPFKPGPVTGLARVAEEREPVQILDMKESPAFRAGDVNVVKFVQLAGARTYLVVPLLKDGQILGVFAIYRPEVRAFTGKQIELVKTFARQAVIAMENVRLFNETKESLERQTATADILRVISSTPTDTKPVFDAIVEATQRLIAGKRAGILLRQGDKFVATAFTFAGFDRIPDEVRVVPLDREKNFPSRAILDGEVVHIPDWQAEEVPEFEKMVAKAYGIQSGVIVPLMRKGEGIGALAVARETVGPYHEKEIALLRSFADQAVIAIENTRMFNETKEALEQQTAISEILRVISDSPTDVQPVLEAVAQRAAQICDAPDARIFLVEGDRARNVAGIGDVPITIKLGDTLPLKRGLVVGRAILDRVPVHIEDMQTVSREEMPLAREIADRSGYRSVLVVPLLREARALGAIILRRMEVRPFTEKQIALLKTFADQAAIAIENVRLFNETKEALERQTATAEILKVIASSPSDVQPVFDAIAASARRLLAGGAALVARRAGDKLELAAYTSSGEIADAELRKQFPAAITGRGHMGKAILSAAPVGISDVQTDETYSEAFRASARARGVRSIVSVPMLRDGEPIGVISVNRSVPGKFSEHQTNLLKTFADQAVIAIENVRLFNETTESLERQTATSEILQVISSTPTDARPVFSAIVEGALRVFDGMGVHISLLRNGRLELEAEGGITREATSRDYPIPVDRDSASGTCILERNVVNIADAQASDAPRRARENAAGFRALACAPLMRQGEPIGVISVSRKTAGALTDKQVALLQTFADQAVIAIENARLFNETKESLERQTATAEILKVISGSPTDEKPVFDAIVASAARLFGRRARIRLVEDGRLIMRARSDGPVTDGVADEPLLLDRESAGGRVALDRAALQIADTVAPDAPASARKWGEVGGYRAISVAPLMRENTVLGVISVTSPEPGGLAEKQMALLQTFADQAVIAIENVRLFNETKEGLEQQTAISEVLRVISSSPADVKPVLDAVAVRAARICDAHDARIFLAEGESYRYVAGFGDVGIGTPIISLDRDTPTGRAIIDRAPQHVEDILALPEEEFPRARAIALKSGWRTILSVPLLREGRALGSIVLRRKEVRRFSEKQVALLQTFADQAAIAIENVRLFNATREALEQQTATSEVLNVISSSITDARPAFDAIARSVLKLYGARSVGLYVRIGEQIDRVGYALSDASADDDTHALWPIPLDERSLTGRAILRADLVHIRDVETEEGLSEQSRTIARKTGARSVLVAPMHSMGAAAGALAIARRSPGGFNEREVEMVRTFADQAVIAMENVRLFKEIEDKSAQLKVASEHKSQFLASMSHELRTPLNALLGFNEMLLGDVYGEVPGDMKPPLAQMQASGKHLLRLINNVLDLAKIEAGRMELALADYSVQDIVEGVRSTLRPLAAEKGLELLAAVPADIPLAYGDPGRITQCLVNLAGNSLKFTKSGKVEISVAADNGLLRYRVADTGIGIPADKIGSLFTEFKQTDATVASEYGGTGLGLAISKKFVEMHGGRIWVESEPGRGSVFTFEVPLRTRGAGAAT